MREPSPFSLGCQRQPNEFMISARPPLPLSLPSPMLAKARAVDDAAFYGVAILLVDVEHRLGHD
jgi:hypothetical protein